MQDIKTILVPVDLSDTSQPAIELATNLAKSNSAKIIFCYVALPVLPAEAMYAQTQMDELIAREQSELDSLAPSDPDVPFEHEFLRGNPGPVIVKFAKENDCDMIVIATHGRTGVIRLVFGSVAEYVIRHSQVPVVSLKTPSIWGTETEEDAHSDRPFQRAPFVTTIMSHAIPIHEFDDMQRVIQELKAAKVTGAPVVNGLGKCIGILTDSDIQNYQEVWKRFQSQDPTVLDEVLETDSYGLRRTDKSAFHKVKKQMSTPVITIPDTTTCREASGYFRDNPEIHHLIVVDESEMPVGIIESDQVHEFELEGEANPTVHMS